MKSLLKDTGDKNKLARPLENYYSKHSFSQHATVTTVTKIKQRQIVSQIPYTV